MAIRTRTKMRVYLSYAVADREPAQRIAACMAEQGFDVWDPAVEIHPGANFALERSKALNQCTAMVVLISPASMRSEHVPREIDFALGSIRYRERLIAVEVRATRDVPWILEELQYVRAGRDWEAAAERAVAALKKSEDGASR